MFGTLRRRFRDHHVSVAILRHLWPLTALSCKPGWGVVSEDTQECPDLARPILTRPFEGLLHCLAFCYSRKMISEVLLLERVTTYA